MDLETVRTRARSAWIGLRHPTPAKRLQGVRDSVEPPPCPEGFHTAPPDFVGVGVMKAGTSWWYRLITDHPAISEVADRAKELHFFDGYAGVAFDDEDIARYERFFPRPPGGIAGEWTPRYLFDFWTPGLLARAAPDVKCLVLLRDPVDRFLSGMKQEARRGSVRNPRLLNDHFARGLYSAQLERLWSAVARERTLVLQYERCVADPAGELARTYEFLGVDPGHRPPHLADRVNPTRFADTVFDDAALIDLAQAYALDVGRVGALCPELDLDLWRTTSGLDGS